ncbi:hypothetical protein PV728_44110 [Streptomyces europaeiscabiei]|uniref:hypothetical protein n=1 Tax=Streptomyces europaeiscabiei TaxID=146819 RepID=UPI0029BAE2AF|nr:hypothetical protein [Streptomyces europaeiscabiei]MDX3637060.1 hypothetical protein [Streptomyces europaeiscabiei]MDX3655204.1 hypothetical protein [Streptomyces europaeiscabiei]
MRRAEARAAAEEKALRAYPDEQDLLARVLSRRYTVDELLSILTVIENQFVAERAGRSLMTTEPGLLWQGNKDLAEVQLRLQRILLRISTHLSRQPRTLQGLVNLNRVPRGRVPRLKG